MLFLFILFIGIKLISSSPKNEIQENIEVEKEIDNEMEELKQKEMEKTLQITLFIMKNQEELSVTEEQFKKVYNAYNEYIEKNIENMKKSLDAHLSGIPYDSLKVDKEIIDNYYSNLKDVLSKEIYDKCVSYSAEELKKLNLEKYKEELRDMAVFLKNSKEISEKYNIEKYTTEKNNVDDDTGIK